MSRPGEPLSATLSHDGQSAQDEPMAPLEPLDRKARLGILLMGLVGVAFLIWVIIV